MEKAYFATGCFWGAERRYWKIDGVVNTSVGYMGGTTANPSYEQVCTGSTGHAEMVCVEFDPAVVSYRRLLEEFWTMHDPTSLNAQGGDIGTQYRSAIYFTNAAQQEIAESTRDQYQTTFLANEIIFYFSRIIIGNINLAALSLPYQTNKTKSWP